MAEESLAQRLLRSGPLSLAALTPIVDDLLEELAQAHAQDVVYGEVNPTTVLLDPHGVPRARVIGIGEATPTEQAGRQDEPDLRGRPSIVSFSYLAPEQVRAKGTVDGRTDVYAVGVIVFHALTGQLPFDGGDALSLVAQKLDRAPPALPGDAWPALLRAFVATAMALDANDRYASASAALAAWRRITLS